MDNLLPDASNGGRDAQDHYSIHGFIRNRARHDAGEAQHSGLQTTAAAPRRHCRGGLGGKRRLLITKKVMLAVEAHIRSANTESRLCRAQAEPSRLLKCSNEAPAKYLYVAVSH